MIEIRNITKKYPGQEKPALDNFRSPWSKRGGENHNDQVNVYFADTR